MKDQKVSTDVENTTSETKEKKFTFKGSPGVTPKNLKSKDIKIWNEEYNRLSSEEKTLLEIQVQTKLIRRVSNNVIFYFWLSIISIGLSLMLTLQYLDSM